MSISDRKGSNFFWTRVLERSAKYEKMCDMRRKIDGLEDNGSLIELENGSLVERGSTSNYSSVISKTSRPRTTSDLLRRTKNRKRHSEVSDNVGAPFSPGGRSAMTGASRASMRYAEHSMRANSFDGGYEGSVSTLGGPEQEGEEEVFDEEEGQGSIKVIPSISLFRPRSVASSSAGGSAASSRRRARGRPLKKYTPSPRMLSHPAATLAMATQRRRDILSVRDLATSGSLTTLSMAGTGKLLPSSSIKRAAEAEDKEAQDFIYDDDGEEENLVATMTAKELNEIQENRRFALNQHMGEHKTDVDRNLTPLQKREMRQMMEEARKQDLINRNMSKAELRAEEQRYIGCVKSWLVNVVLHKHMQNFKKHFDSNLEAGLERQRRNVAAKKIQETWEAYWAPFRTEKKKRIQVTLMKFSFRLLSRLARARIRIAKRRVLAFYKDFSRQRFAFVMVKFRFNCVKLQRRIRSYGQCTKARLLVLSMLWNKLEPGIKNKVEKELDTAGNGPNSSRWKVKVSLPRFPELSQQINSVTEDTIGLKKTIQKGVNAVSATLPQLLQEAKRKEAKDKLKGKRRNTHLMAADQDVSYKGVVPEADKMDAMKSWLTARRTIHGEYGWQLTRGGSVEAKQLNMHNAAKIISGELDIREHVDYKVNKIDWPTMMMITDKTEMSDFKVVIEESVKIAINRKNNEIQRLVKARLKKELAKQAVKLSELPGGYRYHTDTGEGGGGVGGGSPARGEGGGGIGGGRGKRTTTFDGVGDQKEKNVYSVGAGVSKDVVAGGSKRRKNSKRKGNDGSGGGAVKVTTTKAIVKTSVKTSTVILEVPDLNSTKK
ncbi:hypothetical protein TrVE_jg2463 [Triparma verrucosa]|uniref:Uncharacterized protein n=1 Tax=Triparma verrucosa TaxID=1606542 RepID=A0A9W7C5Y1_9STRA|nr:hypothetical protein TrVE_jg2463 [Triparma verrucosa]